MENVPNARSVRWMSDRDFDMRDASVIAVRRLALDAGPDENEAILIEIFTPIREGPESYFCTFAVHGLPAEIVHNAGGIDSAQAILNAFHGIDFVLRPYKGRLSWIERGDIGFPSIWR